MKKEVDETVDDEAKEPLEEKTKEESSGEESSSDHAIIPEEFQTKVVELIDEYKDSKPCLAFIRERVYDAEEQLRTKKTKGKKIPASFSVEDMP